MASWSELSNEISQAVQAVGKSIVTVQPRGGRTSSGIILDEHTIITTARSVANESSVQVWTSSDESATAKLKGSDPSTDIAVLQVEKKVGPAAVFAEGPQLTVGQLLVAIGRTWRGNLVASAGILSGLMGEWHTFRGGKLDAFIRPDLTLYSGFSGGALVSADQKIIGMNTTSLRRGSPLTVPYATIKRVAAALADKGYIPKPYLGLGLQPVRVPESLQQKLNLTDEMGALVVHVEASSPAEKAGVLLGDVLLRVDGQSFGVGTASVVRGLKPDQNVEVSGTRGGQQFSASVLVGERPRRRP
jgi:S1-C subfamily serine protease